MIRTVWNHGEDVGGAPDISLERQTKTQHIELKGYTALSGYESFEAPPQVCHSGWVIVSGVSLG